MNKIKEMLLTIGTGLVIFLIGVLAIVALAIPSILLYCSGLVIMEVALIIYLVLIVITLSAIVGNEYRKIMQRRR